MQIEAYRRGRRKPEAFGPKISPNGFEAALAIERGYVVLAEGVAIPLKRGKGKALITAWTWVSFEDRHLGRYFWSANNWNYPRRRDKRGESIMLHREVMQCSPGDGLVVDHINRDRFDNRRENLRFVTIQENAQNQTPRQGGTSKYRGVSFRRGKWVVVHGQNGRPTWGGDYDDEDVAGMAALQWRRENMPFAID